MNSVHEDLRNGRGENTRRLILETARGILARDGYEGFCIRRLAAAINCATGTIYVHFKNKDDLVQTLIDEKFERLHDALTGLRQRHESGDPVVVLRKAMYTYVEFGLRNSNDYRLAFLVNSPVSEQSDRKQPGFEMLRVMLARCVNEGRFRRVDVETAAQALWAAVHGITSLLIQRPHFAWVGRTRVIEQVISNSVDSLLAQPVLAAANRVHRQHSL
jgi:AcrR family transcriptional regulator